MRTEGGVARLRTGNLETKFGAPPPGCQLSAVCPLQIDCRQTGPRTVQSARLSSRHVWFFQRRRYEEGGPAAPAGGRAQPREGLSGCRRLKTVLSAECSTRPPPDWSVFKYKSLQTPESLFFFVVK